MIKRKILALLLCAGLLAGLSACGSDFSEFDEAFDAAVRMLYLQRCGMELKEEYAGEFAHPVCHDGGAVIHAELLISGRAPDDPKGDVPTMPIKIEGVDVSGGWHNGGDYGRYVVSGAKAAADVMLAYESYPEAFGDNAGIPESGNGTPDILDEARYELEWLLKMQDSITGGVYHKVTCANFSETVMPEAETDELILSPMSNCATGDFAAVMAMAARVYKDVDGDFADTCMAAALKAVAYLEGSESGDGFVNPEGIMTEEYSDTKDTDERYWAYAELFKTTKESKYEEILIEIPYASIQGGLGWKNVGYYGGYAYLTGGYTNKEYAETVRSALEYVTNGIRESAEADTYRCSVSGAYPRGSNMSIANNGMLLLMMDEIDGNDKYEGLAKAQMDYLLGNNADACCFLTGFGSVSPRHPCHRPSQVLDKSMEGMLVGGADSAEVAVYLNSPLIYLMAAYK